MMPLAGSYPSCPKASLQMASARFRFLNSSMMILSVFQKLGSFLRGGILKN